MNHQLNLPNQLHKPNLRLLLSYSSNPDFNVDICIKEFMNKVTYLFGAGASIEAVPIVNQIPERLRNFRNEIEKVNIGELRDNQIKGRII